MTEPSTPKTESAEPTKPKSSPLPLIASVAGGLVLGAIAGPMLVAPRIVAGRTAHATTASTEHADEEEGHGSGKAGAHGGDHRRPVFKLENIIVNPAGSGGTRFLMATVAIECPDDKLESRLRDREVQVRDRVMAVLEAQTLEALTRPGAREDLRQQITTAILPVAGKSAGLRVYLPQLVIQ